MSAPQSNRFALMLFSIYLLMYGGFIAINLLNPDMMEQTPFAGVNLAIWYGFGLIFMAVLLAFIYGFSFSGSSKQVSQDEDSDDTTSSKEASK